jgi:hypothetical protein
VDEIRQAEIFYNRKRNDYCIFKNSAGTLAVAKVLCMFSFIYDTNHDVLCIEELKPVGREEGTGMVLLQRLNDCRFIFTHQVERLALVQPDWDPSDLDNCAGRFLLNDLGDLYMLYRLKAIK